MAVGFGATVTGLLFVFAGFPVADESQDGFRYFRSVGAWMWRTGIPTMVVGLVIALV
ncbi:MAG: hypothetical protein QOJ09_804 [Actinomycetota bacterium]|jgi:hypothetical protein|nr:hypothetical protein [Actinomycetota bacterium]